MAANATPREKLDQIFQFLDRAKRYWWLTAGLMVVGGVLSVLFATSRPKQYTSSAVLYYQEHIQTSLVQGGDEQAPLTVEGFPLFHREPVLFV